MNLNSFIFQAWKVMEFSWRSWKIKVMLVQMLYQGQCKIETSN